LEKNKDARVDAEIEKGNYYVLPASARRQNCITFSKLALVVEY